MKGRTLKALVVAGGIALAAVGLADPVHAAPSNSATLQKVCFRTDGAPRTEPVETGFDHTCRWFGDASKGVIQFERTCLRVGGVYSQTVGEVGEDVGHCQTTQI